MNESKQYRDVSRRQALIVVGAGGLAAAGLALLPRAALADAAAVDEAIKGLIGGKTPRAGRITLELPQIAENGNTVPITVEVDSPMTGQDYCKTVHLFADKNPRPDVASIHFTPACGKAKASSRMRLAKTQNVVAVAEMSDGSVYTAKGEVKVSIGACGG